jgi:tRNA threonylcarbamoyl adenosine modification protein (Sua5/YciO/YrdC/YwlC family)
MILNIHPQNPQIRLIKQAADILLSGGVIVYPTDSGYGIGTKLANKKGLEHILRMRNLEKGHYGTILLDDIKHIATYAQVDNNAFRLLKRVSPAPITFIFAATKQVPKMLLQKRKTIGVRIVDNPIITALLTALAEPIINFSVYDDREFYDTDDIIDDYQKQVDLIIDGGYPNLSPTTILDLTSGKIEVLREGAFDTNNL